MSKRKTPDKNAAREKKAPREALTKPAAKNDPVLKKPAAKKRTATKKAAAKKAPPKPKAKRKPQPVSHMKGDKWSLRLYVAGDTPRSVAARENLQRLCEKHLPAKCKIEVIDLVEHPELASADQVLAIPTLVRRLPPPIKRIIGDLSNEERAMIALDLRQV